MQLFPFSPIPLSAVQATTGGAASAAASIPTNATQMRVVNSGGTNALRVEVAGPGGSGAVADATKSMLVSPNSSVTISCPPGGTWSVIQVTGSTTVDISFGAGN